MKLAIIHIGDLHISENTIEQIDESIENLGNKIISETIGIKFIIFAVSGDIVNSGAKDQYEYADLLVDSIKTKLADKSVNFIFAPGNHDSVLDEKNTSRIDNINYIITKFNADSSRIESCCSVQRNFFEFSKKYYFLNEIHSCKLSYCGFQNIDDVNLVFRVLNTSWLSQKHEQPSAVWIPIDAIDSEIDYPDKSFIITMFHHPTNWLNPSSIDKKKIEDSIFDNSHLVLTGHEHYDNLKKFENEMHGESTILLGTNQYNGLDGSGFNLSILDFENLNNRIMSFKYTQGTFKTTREKNFKIELSYKFDLTQEMQNELNDIGFKLTHPTHGEVSLNDVFVWPNVDELVNENIEPAYYSFTEILNQEETPLQLLFGSEQSGKTTLLKKSFEFYKKDFLPIFIDGKDIKNSNINKHIKSNLKRQYKNLDWDTYSSLPIEQRIVMIDDFDKAEIDKEKKSEIISYLNEFFGKNYVSMSDLQLYRSKKELTDIFGSNAKRYKIKAFGFNKRDELFKKWISLSNEIDMDDNELVFQIENFQKKVESVILSKVIKPYPFYLLNILQISSSAVANNYKLTRYGDCYDAFISISLSKEKILKRDAYMNFLTQFSYKLYNEKYHSTDRKDFDEYFSTYSDEFNPPEDSPSLVLDNLLNARILKLTHDNRVLFNQPYVYYFCVARYISKNYENDEVKKVVEEISTKVYVYENGNILIFLTHFLDNTTFWDELLSKVKDIFKDRNIEKLGEESTKYLNSLFEKMPELVIEEKESVIKRRQEMQKQKDDIDHLSEQQSNEEDINETDKDSSSTDLEDDDIFNKILVQIKYMEIYGQILKNRYGSLPKRLIQKFSLESIDSSLRLLNFMINAQEDSLDIATDFIKEKMIELNGNKHIDEDKFTKLAKSFLLAISFSTINAVLTKCATSLGDPELLDDNKKIVETNQYPAYELIYMIMRMEYKNEFPFTALVELKNKYENNLFVFNMLRHLIYQYLYMHSVSFKIKPQIEKEFGIKITKQIAIQGKRKQ